MTVIRTFYDYVRLYIIDQAPRCEKEGLFLPRGMTAVFAVAEAPVSVDTHL